MLILTISLLALILLGFMLMTRGTLRQEVAMPLVALGAVSLASLTGPDEGTHALEAGFEEFSRIAILFTAVAVPAHILQRSGFLEWVGIVVGGLIGKVHARTRISLLILVPFFSLFLVYILAAFFHNTTSILVSASIVYVICDSYKLRALPVLSGALVASNLGGFSTSWGDTPNILEARQWQLNHGDFFFEIAPLNITSMLILILAVSAWLWFRFRQQTTMGTPFEIQYARVLFMREQERMSLDGRLIAVGFVGLVIAIIPPLFVPEYDILFSAIGIIISVLLDYADHRTESLLALGIETYATLASIFVLAQVLAHSDIGIGMAIEGWLRQSGMSVWAIASASYIGTLLTEAASWASVATPIVHAQAPTHIAAWALGAGIFAGSSSLVTAASAGIILTQQTKHLPENSRITFGSYIKFGLPFSLFILGYYILVLSLFSLWS